MSEAAAVEYLRCPPNARWRWDETGEVLTWDDGTTLAFRAEIELILERLVPTGLPPFPSLVYLLATLKGRTDLLDTPAPVSPDRNQLVLLLETRQQQQVSDKLAVFSRLPAELIGTPAAKAVLAEIVFEPTTRRSAEESRHIVDGLPYAWNEAILNTALGDAAPFQPITTAGALADASSRFTPESLLLRLRTGLDALPTAGPEVAIPHELRARRLLEALERDEAMSAFARVVRDLTAAIRLPRALTEPDDLPLGGAADIGNRGALDRLLLSELAHDDLTLATRVALNEALYLRREPPTHRPERGLALLLDAGVRMWGVPRVVAAAAALSLALHHRGSGAFLAWRAKARQLCPIDLLEKSSLEAHLAALETDLNPLAAIPRFMGELTERDDCDAVVITHRDVLGDGDFQARLGQEQFDRGFLLLVDRDGSVELHRLPWGGQRPLAYTRIQPARLHPPAPVRAAAPLLAPDPKDFPAIFRLNPFPLRMPLPGKFEAEANASHGNVGVTKDRRLLAWEQTAMGARQLATDLPDGAMVWLMRHVDGRVFLVRGRGGDGNVSVVLVSAGGDTVRCLKLSGPPRPRSAWFSSGLIYVALHTRVVCIDPATADVKGEAPVPEGISHLNGRYYRSGDGMRFATWNGTAVMWDHVASGARLSIEEIVTAFDRQGIGAWIVMRQGKIIGPTGSEFFDAKISVNGVQIFRDGDFVALLDTRSNLWHTVDLAGRRILDVGNAPGKKAEMPRTGSKWTLQNRFTAIGGGSGEPVRLRTHKGAWLELYATNGGRAFQLTPAAAVPREVLTFEATPASPSLGCSLRTAVWPGGSQAWLDSRGWLHLRAADRAVPEMSIGLSYNAPVAIWCSDGVVAAPAFFTGSDASSDHKQAAANLKRITEALC